LVAHVNFYGRFTFRESQNEIELADIVDALEAAHAGRGAGVEWKAESEDELFSY